MTHEVSVSISVEILSKLPSKPSRNAVIMDFIKNYLLFKPETPDLSQYDCIQCSNFTVRFKDETLHQAFEAECARQLRSPSNLLTVILAASQNQQAAA